MSDLIDRESAIVRATKVIKDDGVAHDVMEVLRDMPSASQWIKCSDRLPNKDDVCIVFGYWEDKEKITLCNFRTDLGRFGASWRFDIKAWMPLPEPYEVNENEV